MAGYADHDQVWLVKSAGMVLGPFSLTELVAALREHRVSILDEVRNPMARWRFVREQPSLVDVVKEVRESEARFDQETGRTTAETSPNNSAAVSEPSIQKTDLPAGFDDETTPIPEHFTSILRPERRQKTDGKSAVDGGAKERKEKSEGHRASATFADLAQPVALPSKSPSERKSEYRSKILAFVVGAVLAGLLLFAAWYFIGSKSSSNHLTQQQLLQLARKEKDRGAFDKSLAFVNRARQQQAVDPNLLIEFVPEMLLTLESSKDVDAIVNDSRVMVNSNNKALWLALDKMLRGRHHEAHLQLQEMLSQETPHDKLPINYLISCLQIGSFSALSEARQVFQGRKIFHPLFSVVTGLGQLQLLEKKLDDHEGKLPNEVNATIAELKTESQSSENLRYEKTLLLVALEMANAGQAPDMHLLFERDPRQQAQFLPELEVDQQILEHRRWSELCRSMLGKVTDVAKVELGAACFAYDGDWDGVTSQIENLRRLNVSPQSLHRWTAQLAAQQNHWVQARSEAEASDGVLAQQVLAESCLRLKDFPCVAKTIQNLQAAQVPFFVRQIQVREHMGQMQRELARQELERGLQQAKNYRPLLELQEDVLGF